MVLKNLAPSGLLNIVFTRRAGSYTKFARWYRQLWEATPPVPPYSHVCQVGDPVLRLEAQPVQTRDIRASNIQKVVNRLKQVLRRYDAAGLSAPQIGVPLKIFVMEFTESHKQEYSPETYKLREMSSVPLKVFINPELKIVDYEKVVFPEACESVRGFYADVPRYRKVVVSGLDEAGRAVSWQASGWAARIVQHEMDHLQGRLYTDVMLRKSLTCSCWQKVNETGGRLHIPFTPRKGAARYFLRATT